MLDTKDKKPIELEDFVGGEPETETGLVEASETAALDEVETPRPPAHVWRKAPVLRRIIADVIDRLLCCPLIVYFFPPWLMVVMAYDLLSDGLMDGCSVGKRLMGLRTVIVSNGKPCNFARSFLRNVGWTGARLCYTSLWLVPLALTYDAIELLLVLFSPSGQRLGDRLAGTQVTTEQ